MRMTSDRWKDVDSQTQFPFLHPESAERPDSIIIPGQSMLLEVGCAEIVPTNMYAAGHTLRFPRFKAFRIDKNVDECCTVEQFRHAIDSSSTRFANRLKREMSGQGQKKAKTRASARAVVSDELLGVSASSVTKIGAIFEGLQVCIMAGCGDYDKKELEKLVLSHGGTIVQNPGRETTFVVADRKDIRVGNIERSGKYDIFRSSYIEKCVKSRTRIQPDPRHMLYTTEKTKEKLLCDNVCDEFDDVFQSMFTAESVEKVAARSSH